MHHCSATQGAASSGQNDDDMSLAPDQEQLGCLAPPCKVQRIEATASSSLFATRVQPVSQPSEPPAVSERQLAAYGSGAAGALENRRLSHLSTRAYAAVSPPAVWALRDASANGCLEALTVKADQDTASTHLAPPFFNAVPSHEPKQVRSASDAAPSAASCAEELNRAFAQLEHHLQQAAPKRAPFLPPAPIVPGALAFHHPCPFPPMPQHIAPNGTSAKRRSGSSLNHLMSAVQAPAAAAHDDDMSVDINIDDCDVDINIDDCDDGPLYMQRLPAHAHDDGGGGAHHQQQHGLFGKENDRGGAARPVFAHHSQPEGCGVLSKMFAMPFYCVNASPDVNTFLEATNAAASMFKLLIVNVLDQTMASLNQNRDLWPLEVVAGLVIEHYCLFQLHKTSAAAAEYLDVYPLCQGPHTLHLPIIDIIDPLTGIFIERLSGVIAVQDLCSRLRAHVDSGGASFVSPHRATSQSSHASMASQGDGVSAWSSASDDGWHDSSASREAVDQGDIYSMGFDPSLVERALIMTGGEEEQAIDAILTGAVPSSDEWNPAESTMDGHSSIHCMGFDASLVDGALLITGDNEEHALHAILDGDVPSSLVQSNSLCWQQLAVPLELQPDVNTLPYKQRKCAILYGATLPSMVNLGECNDVNGVSGESVSQNFDFSRMSRSSVLKLARQLKAHPCHLTLLNLCGNHIGRDIIQVDAMRQLVNSIALLTGLQTLNLRDNSLGEDGGAALGRSLTSLTRLKRLDLCNNDLGSYGGAAVGRAMTALIALQELNLMENDIGSSGGAVLEQSLTALIGLQTLNLSNNSLRAKGGASVGRSLTALTALQRLDLSRNDLGAEAGAVVGRSLTALTALETLSLYGNASDISTCCRIASSIVRLPWLQCAELDCSPSRCIQSGDWQRAGLGVPPPPEVTSRWFDWIDALHYKSFLTCCKIVCSSSSRLARSIRLAAPDIQLPLDVATTAAGAAAVVHLPRLTHAQLQLLLSTAGHVCHFFRVMMPRDVRHIKDPREELRLRLFSDAMAWRLARLSLR